MYNYFAAVYKVKGKISDSLFFRPLAHYLKRKTRNELIHYCKKPTKLFMK